MNLRIRQTHALSIGREAEWAGRLTLMQMAPHQIGQPAHVRRGTAQQKWTVAPHNRYLLILRAVVAPPRLLQRLNSLLIVKETTKALVLLRLLVPRQTQPWTLS